MGPIQEQAQNLARQLGNLHGPVNVLAHSMGGLVCRYYLKELAGDGQVRLLITLATPHFGTEKARVGIGVAARQMVPGSEFLKELNQGMIKGARLFALWSDFDGMVVPPENAVVKENDIPLDLTGHNAFLFKKKVARVIYEILSSK